MIDMTDILCDYGCGKPYKYTSKNGKHCCSSHHTKCDGVNKKRLLGIKKYTKEQQKIDPKSGRSYASLHALKREKKKRKTIDPKTGLTMNIVGAFRAAETKANIIDPESGLNISQIAGLKGFKTTSTTIDEKTGLSQRALQGKKHSEMLLQIDSVTGLTKAQMAGQKCLKTKLKIDENGLNSFERGYIKSLKMHYYKDTDILYQGSGEKRFLEELEEEHGILWVCENVKRGPNIPYQHPIDQCEKMFMVDFQIENKLCEVKSTYTWDGEGKRLDWKQINEAKLQGARDQGWEIYLKIY